MIFIFLIEDWISAASFTLEMIENCRIKPGTWLGSHKVTSLVTNLYRERGYLLIM
jgi:hypothetical protein